jgi:hypothetical protein
MEGTAKHFHSHLDLFVNGQRTPVAANIGIDETSGEMSELHTHDDSGILHIEAPTADKTYTLGQLFSEWQVRLDATSIGGLKADANSAVRAYVDGKPVSGDPGRIELMPHQEIALFYGAKNAKFTPPSSYNWPAGL